MYAPAILLLIRILERFLLVKMKVFMWPLFVGGGRTLCPDPALVGQRSLSAVSFPVQEDAGPTDATLNLECWTFFTVYSDCLPYLLHVNLSPFFLPLIIRGRKWNITYCTPFSPFFGLKISRVRTIYRPPPCHWVTSINLICCIVSARIGICLTKFSPHPLP